MNTRSLILMSAWMALASIHRPAPAGSQTKVDSALAFFRAGGAYCLRVTPPGVALSEEAEWTVMVLTSAANRKTVFKIRELDPGNTGLRGGRLRAMGEDVTDVWKLDRVRQDFFERFARGIADRELRASVVRISPGNLATLTSGPARAELYLKFSGRGSRVAFGSANDLEAGQLAEYADYLPD